jgi:hypothetical protein
VVEALSGELAGNDEILEYEILLKLNNDFVLVSNSANSFGYYSDI